MWPLLLIIADHAIYGFRTNRSKSLHLASFKGAKIKVTRSHKAQTKNVMIYIPIHNIVYIYSAAVTSQF